LSKEKQPWTRLDVCRRFVETVRHSTNLGIEVLEARETSVRCRMAWREDLVGNPDTGVLHGGAVFAFMDQAGGLANACAIYPNFEITPTIDFRVDHLGAPEPGQAVICEAECYRLSSQVTFVRLTTFAENDEQRPVATGLATYMRMKIPGPGAPGEAAHG
jgi:uncharacterized protein (TIGR00369 family)